MICLRVLSHFDGINILLNVGSQYRCIHDEGESLLWNGAGRGNRKFQATRVEFKMEQKLVTRGLIIDEPWISLILSGKKTWEMRSTNATIRDGCS
jgi:hypothetical protein